MVDTCIDRYYARETGWNYRRCTRAPSDNRSVALEGKRMPSTCGYFYDAGKPGWWYFLLEIKSLIFCRRINPPDYGPIAFYCETMAHTGSYISDAGQTRNEVSIGLSVTRT